MVCQKRGGSRGLTQAKGGCTGCEASTDRLFEGVHDDPGGAGPGRRSATPFRRGPAWPHDITSKISQGAPGAMRATGEDHLLGGISHGSGNYDSCAGLVLDCVSTADALV